MTNNEAQVLTVKYLRLVVCVGEPVACSQIALAQLPARAVPQRAQPRTRALPALRLLYQVADERVELVQHEGADGATPLSLTQLDLQCAGDEAVVLTRLSW